MDIKFVSRKPGTKVLIYEDYVYHKHSVIGTKAYFNCSFKRNGGGCKAGVLLNGFDINSWEYTDLKWRPHPHNHLPGEKLGKCKPRKKKNIPSHNENCDGQRLETPDLLNLTVAEEETEVNLDIIKQEPVVIENDSSDMDIDDNDNPTIKLCLICNLIVENGGNTFHIGSHKRLSQSEAILNPNIWPIFIVRNLLKLTEMECCQLLSNSANLNPVDWFVLCEDCCTMAASAYQLECKVTMLSKRLRSVKSVLTSKLSQSLLKENGTSFENEYNRPPRDAIRSCFKNKSNNILNQQNLHSASRFLSDSPEADPEPDHDWDDFEDNLVGSMEEQSETDKTTVSLKKTTTFNTTTTVSHKKTKTLSTTTTVKKRRERNFHHKFFGKEGDVYKCYRCPYSASKFSTLRRHAYDHRFRPLKCDQCNFPVINNKRLRSHMKKHHDITIPAPEVDTSDNEDGDSNDNLGPPEADDDFNRNETDNAGLFIPKRNGRAERVRKLKRNAKQKLFGKVGDLFKCYRCPVSSPKYATIRRHSYAHKIATAKCDICNFPALTDKHLAIHISKYHSSVPKEKESQDTCKLGTGPSTSNETGNTHCNDNLSPGSKVDPDSIQNNSTESNKKNLETDKIEIIIPTRRPTSVVVAERLLRKRIRKKVKGVCYGVVDNQYKCYRCPFTSLNYSTIRRHVHDHGTSKQKCTLCNYPLYNASTMTLYIHMKKYHPDEPLPVKKPMIKCDKCSFEGVFNFDLKIHKKNYHDRLDNVDINHELSIYRCKLCPKVFDNEDMTLRHIGREHKNEVGGTPHLCHICAKSYGTVNSLRKHMRFSHTGEKRHKCTVCEMLFHTATLLKKHLATHLSKEEKSVLICDECGHNFETTGGLRKHKLKVHFLGVPKIIKQEGKMNAPAVKPKQFTCRHCGLVCIHIRALKIHLTELHPELFKFECNECGNRYVSSKNLRLHRKKSHGNVL